MKRWSKLKKRLENIFDQNINLQIYITEYKKPDSRRMGPGISRMWLTLDKEIIWDFPKDFEEASNPGCNFDVYGEKLWTGSEYVETLTSLIHEYLDTSSQDLIEFSHKDDYFGFIDMLKAADRRIGKRQWGKLPDSDITSIILNARLKNKVVPAG